MMVILRSLLFHGVLTALTITLGILSPLLALLPEKSQSRFIGACTTGVIHALRICCGLRYRVHGMDNLHRGRQDRCIVMAKHTSTWETLFFQHLLRSPVWVLKRELLTIPFFGWILAVLKPIAIDRSAGKQALDSIIRQSRERLSAHRPLVIFPEGTRSTAGQRAQYKLGGAVVARKTGATVIPIAHNAGWFWPSGGLRIYPGTVQVVIGKPIPGPHRHSAQLMAEVESWIEHTVADLPRRHCATNR